MIYGMARDLRPHNIAPSPGPGFIRTERVAAAFEAAGKQGYLNFTDRRNTWGGQSSHWTSDQTSAGKIREGSGSR